MANTHYCVLHKQPFFKKGKMKGYAHPIVDDNGNPTGEWCNEEEGAPPEPQMTKDDWADKDKITRKSIERQTSLNAAVELAKKIEGVVTTEKIIATAKLFEAYLGGEETKGNLKEQVVKVNKQEVKPLREKPEVASDKAPLPKEAPSYTKEDLYLWIRKNKPAVKKAEHTWAVNSLKISEDLMNTNPLKAKEEIQKLTGWAE